MFFGHIALLKPLFFVTLLFLTFNAWTQKPDTLWALKYLDSADIYAKTADYQTALVFSQKALEIYEQNLGLNAEKVGDVLLIVGYNKELVGDYRGGAKVLNRAIQIYGDKLGNAHVKIAQAHYRLGNCMRYFASGEDCLIHYNKAIEIQEKLLNSGNIALSQSYKSAGLIYTFLPDYESAMKLFRKAEENLKKHKEGEEKDLELAGIYQFIGFLYNEIGDYGQAVEFHQKAMELNIKYLNENHERIGLTYQDIGHNYLLLKSFEEALTQFLKAYEILSQLAGISELRTTEVLMNIGNCYHEQGLYDSAIAYYQKALPIVIDKLTNQHGYYFNLHSWLGNCYINIDNSKRAKFHYQIVQQAPAERFLPEYSVYIAEFYATDHQFDTAFKYYREAFELLKFNLDSPHFSTVKNYPTLGMALNSYARTILKKAKQSNGIEDYKFAETAYDWALQLIDTLRNSYQDSETKLALSRNNYLMFEGGAEVNIKLAELLDEQLHWHKAFRIAEKSKGLLILEAYSQAKAKRLSGITGDLLNKEQELKEAIAMKEKQLFQLQSRASVDLAKVSVIQGQIFDLKQQYKILIQQFEHSFPAYFQLRYNSRVSSVGEIQQKLKHSDELLLEYLVGDKSIFAFLISSDDIQVYQIKKDFPLETWVGQMRRGIYQYHLTPRASQEAYIAYNDTFAVVSHQLYQKLIAPIKDDLPRKLVVIPDGILGYLPFDALLTKPPEQNHSFKSHSYLLQEHEISYSYSATLLEEMQNTPHEKTSKQLLAFAPSFEENTSISASVEARRNGLGPLTYNIPEAESINDIFGGDVFSGRAATKSQFIQHAQEYRVLHLATHGKANDQTGDYSFLAFAQPSDAKKDQKLYVRDLYNLRLNADMVVLSACETGIGELQRGEGIISLARGFSYAGAKSIITTLWSVNDASTKDLMESFYQKLKEGQTKNAALRQAKIDYLNACTNDEAHPFFWAGFIPIGDMTSIKPIRVFHWWWTIGGLLFLLLIWFLFRKRLVFFIKCA